MAARAVWACHPNALWICATVAPLFRVRSLRNWTGRVALAGFGLAVFGLLPVGFGSSGISIIILSVHGTPADPVPCTERSPGIPGDVSVMENDLRVSGCPLGTDTAFN